MLKVWAFRSSSGIRSLKQHGLEKDMSRPWPPIPALAFAVRGHGQDGKPHVGRVNSIYLVEMKEEKMMPNNQHDALFRMPEVPDEWGGDGGAVAYEGKGQSRRGWSRSDIRRVRKQPTLSAQWELLFLILKNISKNEGKCPDFCYVLCLCSSWGLAASGVQGVWRVQTASFRASRGPQMWP